MAVGLQSWRKLISQPQLRRPWQALYGSLTYFRLLCDFCYIKKASALSIFKQTRSVALPCFYLINLLLDAGFRVCFYSPVAPPSSSPCSPRALGMLREAAHIKLGMWMGVTVTRELLRIKHKYFCCMHWPLLSDGEGEMLLFGDLRSLLRLLGRWMGWDPICWVVSQVKLGARSLGSALSQMWFRPQRYLK